MKQAPKSPKPTLIPVQAQPRAGENEIVGMVEDATGKQWLKVRLTVTPEGGKANKALIRLLAKEWGCALSSLSIVSGEASRHKMIRKE